METKEGTKLNSRGHSRIIGLIVLPNSINDLGSDSPPDPDHTPKVRLEYDQRVRRKTR